MYLLVNIRANNENYPQGFQQQFYFRIINGTTVSLNLAWRSLFYPPATSMFRIYFYAFTPYLGK